MVNKTNPKSKKAQPKKKDAEDDSERDNDSETEQSDNEVGKKGRHSTGHRAGLKYAPVGRIHRKIKEALPKDKRCSEDSAVVIGAYLEGLVRTLIQRSQEHANTSGKKTIKTAHVARGIDDLGLSHITRNVSYLL